MPANHKAKNGAENYEIGQRELARLLGRPDSQIRNFMEGTKWPVHLGPALRRIMGLRSDSVGEDGEEAIDPVRERGRKDRADAVLKEMSIEEKRGQLIHRSTVESQWLGIATMACGIIERSKLSQEEKEALKAEFANGMRGL